MPMRLTFDRGTILCDEPCTAGGMKFDPRVRASRAPAHSYSTLVRELAARGIAFLDAVRATTSEPGRFAPIALRPYQQDAVLAWQSCGRRGLVVLPTGAGKTRVAMAAMAECGLRTLVLVPTRVLLEQWQENLAKFYEGPIGLLGDGHVQVEPISVATFESAYRRMAEIGARFDLLVVDEVHHFGSGARDECLWMAIAGARLGLTATPTWSESLDLLMGPIVFELGLGELMGTHLAPLRHIVMHAPLDAEERRLYDGDAKCFFAELLAFRDLAPSGTWTDFMRSACKSASGRTALESWRRMKRIVAACAAKRRILGELLARHREARVLVFTADNESAYSIAREHCILPITSDIKRAERSTSLEHFKSGRVRALVSARVLNEGLDVPDAEIGIVVGATLGQRELQQRIGRLLRPRAGKHAVLYELVAQDTIEASQARRKHAALRS